MSTANLPIYSSKIFSWHFKDKAISYHTSVKWELYFLTGKLMKKGLDTSWHLLLMYKRLKPGQWVDSEGRAEIWSVVTPSPVKMNADTSKPWDWAVGVHQTSFPLETVPASSSYHYNPHRYHHHQCRQRRQRHHYHRQRHHHHHHKVKGYSKESQNHVCEMLDAS